MAEEVAASVRDAFPSSLWERTFFNVSYMSPSTKKILEAGRRTTIRQPWELGVSDFFEPVEKARALFATIINSSPNNISIVPSVSYAIATAAKNFRKKLHEGETILLLGEQFPSNYYMWNALAKKKKANILTVDYPEDFDWTTKIINTIEANDSIRIVALATVHWTDGSFIDIPAISRLCKEKDILLFVDGTQSIGAVPFDIEQVKPDFLAAASYKWLFGTFSVGFMNSDEKYHKDGKPLEHSWMSKIGSSDFSNLTNYNDNFEEGARRFDMGERSHLNLMPMVIAGLEQILEW
eukprot:CAMPEP_0174265606 /NCGR_PEP_ID=MMETSP0439-20130205/27168_1 /TAXON_ID=0 /ORGANISM="Stereomyxa ramosa, Strain Chinc5" /LENGTH=293 /DNA_ID=CAMNT_0015352151 /DNA_START=22 /DNA_END=900 /DNA_ORIENTATION=+